MPRRASVTPGGFFALKLGQPIFYNPNGKRFNRSLKTISYTPAPIGQIRFLLTNSPMPYLTRLHEKARRNSCPRSKLQRHASSSDVGM